MDDLFSLSLCVSREVPDALTGQRAQCPLDKSGKWSRFRVARRPTINLEASKVLPLSDARGYREKRD